MTKDTTNALSQTWLPVLIWMGLIFALSAIPGKALVALPISNLSAFAHFIEFSILGWLVMRAFDAYVPNKMSHEPLTFMRAPGGEQWVRLDGLMGTSALIEEFRQLSTE